MNNKSIKLKVVDPRCNKLQLVKDLKNSFGFDLKKAKDIVDSLCETSNAVMELDVLETEHDEILKSISQSSMYRLGALEVIGKNYLLKPDIRY